MIFLERCGFVWFYDETDNRHIYVKSFACKKPENITSLTPCSEYCFCHYDFNLLHRKTTSDSELSYMELLKLVRRCVYSDKAFDLPVNFCFRFDINGKLNVSPLNFEKNIFPFPDKYIEYLPSVYLVDITKRMFNKDCLSNIEVSAACELLNSLAIKRGITAFKVFCYSCGRMFADFSLLSQSFEGAVWLKLMGLPAKLSHIPHRHFRCIRIQRQSYRRTRIGECDKKYALNTVYYRYINKCAGHCVEYYLKNPSELSALVSEFVSEINAFLPALSNAVPGTVPRDFRYAGVSELLLAESDVEFRYNMKRYISQQRLFYNYYKFREINFLKTEPYKNSVYIEPDTSLKWPERH